MRWNVVVLGSALLTAALAGGGCETREPAPSGGPRRPTPVVVEQTPSPWRAAESGSMQVALPDGELDPTLADAIAAARRTAGKARDRWAAEAAEAAEAAATRGAWAVKWRAATADGGHEFVWVEPAAWSAFRVEGRLASAPRRPLACGRTRDELVSFPADELADWVRYANNDFTGSNDGGFTIRALEARFGPAAGEGGTR